MAGSTAALRIAWCSAVTMAAGVPAGAAMPVHEVWFSAGKPSSAKVGTSGSWGRRVAEATARGRSLPAWMCCRNTTRLSSANCTSPASTAVTYCEPPR